MLRKTTLGVVAGVLFMGVEGLGSLYLIRDLVHGADNQQASQFTLATYLWLAFNVIGNSLGFVASRAAARLPSRGLLRPLADNVSGVAARVMAGAWIAVVAVLAAMALAGRVPASAALGWTLLLGGHVLRLMGLLRIFVSVGDGHLGADKWYQFSMSLLFYATAIVAVRNGATLPWLGLLYALCGGVLYLAGNRWLDGALPATDAAALAAVDSPRSLVTQSASIAGFAAAGFLAGNADALIARSLLDDPSFVQYAVTAKLGQVIALTAGLVPAMYAPRITRGFHAGDHEGVRRHRRQALAVSLGLAGVGAALLVALGQQIARWMLPNGHDVFLEVLWIMAAGAVLQAASLSMANAVNSIAGGGLIRLTVVSAVAAVGCAAVLGRVLGPFGVALGTVAGSVVMVAGLLRLTKRAFQPAPAPLKAPA